MEAKNEVVRRGDCQEGTFSKCREKKKHKNFRKDKGENQTVLRNNIEAWQKRTARAVASLEVEKYYFEKEKKRELTWIPNPKSTWRKRGGFVKKKKDKLGEGGGFHLDLAAPARRLKQQARTKREAHSLKGKFAQDSEGKTSRPLVAGWR